MKDDDIEQKDDFPLRWYEWLWMVPLLFVFRVAAHIAAFVRRLLNRHP